MASNLAHEFPPRVNAARLPVCGIVVNENDNPHVRRSSKS
jgi:hypothetical protein